MRHYFTEETFRNNRKSCIMLTALTVLSIFHYIKTFIFEGCKHDVEFISKLFFRFFSNTWGNLNLKENLAIVSLLLEAKKVYICNWKNSVLKTLNFPQYFWNWFQGNQNDAFSWEQIFNLSDNTTLLK